VKNIGPAPAGTFYVAVVLGRESTGFDIPGLASGGSDHFDLPSVGWAGSQGSTHFDLPSLACGQRALILVNSDGAVAELSYDNNAVTILGRCP
jgi:hypothetical protein